jgi:hypothetical protein
LMGSPGTGRRLKVKASVQLDAIGGHQLSGHGA